MLHAHVIILIGHAAEENVVNIYPHVIQYEALYLHRKNKLFFYLSLYVLSYINLYLCIYMLATDFY